MLRSLGRMHSTLVGYIVKRNRFLIKDPLIDVHACAKSVICLLIAVNVCFLYLSEK